MRQSSFLQVSSVLSACARCFAAHHEHLLHHASAGRRSSMRHLHKSVWLGPFQEVSAQNLCTSSDNRVVIETGVEPVNMHLQRTPHAGCIVGNALCTDVLTEKAVTIHKESKGGQKQAGPKEAKMQAQSQDQKCTHAHKAQSIAGLC
jgi:hypothetical protein